MEEKINELNIKIKEYKEKKEKNEKESQIYNDDSKESLIKKLILFFRLISFKLKKHLKNDK